MNDDDGDGEWRMENDGRWEREEVAEEIDEEEIIEEGIVKKKKMKMMMSEHKDPGSNTLPPA